MGITRDLSYDRKKELTQTGNSRHIVTSCHILGDVINRVREVANLLARMRMSLKCDSNSLSMPVWSAAIERKENCEVNCCSLLEGKNNNVLFI
jgi:hypothetical protein